MLHWPAIRRNAPILIALLGLAGGGAFALAGRPEAASMAWTAGVLPVLATLLVEIVRTLSRGDVGLDLVAALSMASALAVGETLAAAVVALMYAGGEALERFAEGRATREMTALLSRVPRTALRHVDHAIETVPLDAVRPGDRLLVRRGDVVPVDGVVMGGPALADESAVTGESLPMTRRDGEPVLSGSTNVGDPFDIRATTTAGESTYAGIVRLVQEATARRAPATRLADRYALVFTGLTVALALAAWGLSGEAARAVAVLVVATPCPLILAVPVAIVAGLSRAAKAGVLVKGGGPLETLGRIRAVVLDKTGTLTRGEAALQAVDPRPGFDADTVMRLAASLDQSSGHVVAAALVRAARARGLVLAPPADVAETPGEGVTGCVEGRRVAVGGRGFVRALLPDPERAALDLDVSEGGLAVAVAVDGSLAGLIRLADPLREEVAATLAALRQNGVARVVLATGDRRDVAEAVTAGTDIDEIRAGLTPAEKIAVVAEARRHGPVLMAGDGINDAPALAAADLGVAMGARGAAAAAEAAGVVLLADRIEGLATGMAVARRTRTIALQSVIAGLGLSAAGMVAAALGYLPPVQGAIFQEAIDVAVILNALRALRP